MRNWTVSIVSSPVVSIRRVRPCRTRLHIPVERVALCRRRLVPLAPVRGLPRRLIRWASLTMLVPMLLCLLLCLPPHPQWVLRSKPGTFALPVMDVDHTRNVLGLVILDSGDYVHGGGFGAPSPAALAFLNAVPDRIGAKSMVFQHMPMPEYYNVLKPVAANAAFAMQGLSFARRYLLRAGRIANPARRIFGRRHILPLIRQTNSNCCARGISAS